MNQLEFMWTAAMEWSKYPDRYKVSKVFDPMMLAKGMAMAMSGQEIVMNRKAVARYRYVLKIKDAGKLSILHMSDESLAVCEAFCVHLASVAKVEGMTIKFEQVGSSLAARGLKAWQ